MPAGRILVFLLLCVASLSAGAADTYLDELVQRAAEKGLAQRDEWLNLLHYKPYAWRPGMRSLADDPRFFTAPDGKTNPEAELAATLAVFFSNAPETDSTQNPQCTFIARYHWLKQELQFDPARLPEQRCARFERWRASLDPQVLTLVFPAAYLNNPASLYGHTLLRVDAKDQDERTRLLAYAVSYAAATDETNGLVFAVRGIFGGYPGMFAMSPYYAKVTEYNDLENRDIWEYQLNFTPEEIDRLLRHVWELGPIRFDYYFFDENCAYHLLSLFDVARPSLHLTDRFPAWAIPADTVRVVVEQAGLLRATQYRPARSTLLANWQTRLPPERVALAKRLAHGDAAPSDSEVQSLAPEERAPTLDLAFEYLEYERMTGKAAKQEPAAQTAARLRGLLLARSGLDAAPLAPVPVPPVRPDEGHGSARVGLGLGVEDGRAYRDVLLRPVYHDILDPQDGYRPGGQIEFFNLVLRQREGDGGLHVERLNLIDIMSISPRDELLKPLSWKVDAALVRARIPDADRPLIFRLSGGAGRAENRSANALLYGFVEGALDVGRDVEQGYALGLGPSLGALVRVTPSDRIGLFGRALRYGIGDEHDRRDASLVYAHDIGRRVSIRLELTRQREYDLAWSSTGLYAYVYF